MCCIISANDLFSHDIKIKISESRNDTFLISCIMGITDKTYLISIKNRVPSNFAPLIFAPLIFAPLIFAHFPILRPINLCAPLFYCEFTVFHSFVAFFFSPLNFCAFVLRESAPLNFRAD